MTVSVVAVGLPKRVNGRFGDRFQQELDGAHLVASLAMDSVLYTPEYADRVYRRIADVLKKRRDHADWRQPSILKLVVLYLDRFHSNAQCLSDQLGLEAILMPLRVPEACVAHTENQVNRAITALLSESERVLATARDLLGVVDNELNRRRNRTCLLLPKHNYGDRFGDVMACVHEAATHRRSADDFRERLNRVAKTLPKDSQGRFVGRRSLVFKPANALHGQPPPWKDDDSPSRHPDSCVIRGRVRFGVAFDPRLHYDCPLPRRNPKVRRFRSCHGCCTLEAGRKHANIAPNDNVR